MRTVTFELFKFLRKKLNKTNCEEHVGSITTLMRCKLIIWDVMHYFEKECTSSGIVKSLTSLFKKIVVAATVMKKAHEKPAPALINLI